MSDDGFEHYEAVVVGAGPGGAAAAASLADRGVETLVLERGTEAGTKNVSGGLLYGESSAPYTLDDLFPGVREAATERPVADHYIHNLAGGKVRTFDLGGVHHDDTEWCDAVLRRRLDAWLAERVHEKTRETGGGLLTDVHVDGLLRDNSGAIVGVTCEELDPIRADLVVAADGVNSELARDADLMDWDDPDEWFQGVKAVVEMPDGAIEQQFDVEAGEGVAHLFSGDLFAGVRGGGFLYTNEDSLSIGTVFHLDSIAEERVESHELLDALLTHPLLGRWLPEEYVELEYSAKLVPDSKKVAHPSPHDGRLVLVGDAAGQMQAQGPIIKGMNHAVTAGALAGEAFAEAREEGAPATAGRRYERKLRNSGTMAKLRPRRYEYTSPVTESGPVSAVTDALAGSALGRAAVQALPLERLYNSPFLLGMLPDTKTPYATLPRVIAKATGDPVSEENGVEPPSLEDRIGDLTYDVGDPHIHVEDDDWAASGTAVTACPVSAADFGGGCWRGEEVRTNGSVERRVSLDTQPCVECGTCAVVADTDWNHPAGGKGVEYEQG
jgi:electron transfer flavoprotein-quinone oxidoreductase